MEDESSKGVPVGVLRNLGLKADSRVNSIIRQTTDAVIPHSVPDAR